MVVISEYNHRACQVAIGPDRLRLSQSLRTCEVPTLLSSCVLLPAVLDKVPFLQYTMIVSPEPPACRAGCISFAKTLKFSVMLSWLQYFIHVSSIQMDQIPQS